MNVLFGPEHVASGQFKFVRPKEPPRCDRCEGPFGKGKAYVYQVNAGPGSTFYIDVCEKCHKEVSQ